jgi:hypothetical protein
MNLTQDFSLEELCRSQAADRSSIDNTPNDEQVANLLALCENVLQPLRDLLGESIHIDSGFRNPVVNALVGGVANSQHLEGKAADTVCGLSTIDWATFILNKGIDFDQLILEFYSAEKGPHSGWVHISYNGGKNRQQIYTAKKNNGKTIYLPGVIE